MEGIDSMLLPDKAFQITVQTRRTFPLECVVSLMKKLNLKKNELKFYYVVPKNIFNDFKCQKKNVPNNIKVYVACPSRYESSIEI